MLVLVLFVFTAIFLVINFIVKWRKFLILASKIPGPKGHIPLIGVLPEFIGADLQDLFNIGLRYVKTSGSLVKLWFGPELIVGITTAENIQKVLNSKECLDKPKFFRFFGIQQASLFGTFEAWKRHRKILNPAFSPQVLKDFVPIFDDKSRILIKNLREQCDKSEFNIYPHMSIFFLESILSAGLDLHVDIQTSGLREDYVKYFEE